MATQAVSASLVPKGVNEGNSFVAEAVLGAMSSSDTATVTIPEGCDPAAKPVLATVTTQSGNVVTNVGNIAITSHDAAAGVTTLTASGSIAAGAKLVVHYVGA